MLATIVLNRYSAVEAKHLAEAIDDVCSPTDTLGWASSGIYVFWDFVNGDVLYVGLAVDLALRFRHHNGLKRCRADCCKCDNIAAHFVRQGDLGYSVFLQSSLDQAVCERWNHANPNKIEWIAENFGYLSSKAVTRVLNQAVDKTLRRTEGALLEAYRVEHGRLPAWNRIGGYDRNYDEEELRQGRELLEAQASHRNWKEAVGVGGFSRSR